MEDDVSYCAVCVCVKYGAKYTYTILLAIYACVRACVYIVCIIVRAIQIRKKKSVL